MKPSAIGPWCQLPARCQEPGNHNNTRPTLLIRAERGDKISRCCGYDSWQVIKHLDDS